MRICSLIFSRKYATMCTSTFFAKKNVFFEEVNAYHRQIENNARRDVRLRRDRMPQDVRSRLETKSRRVVARQGKEGNPFTVYGQKKRKRIAPVYRTRIRLGPDENMAFERNMRAERLFRGNGAERNDQEMVGG